MIDKHLKNFIILNVILLSIYVVFNVKNIKLFDELSQKTEYLLNRELVVFDIISRVRNLENDFFKFSEFDNGNEFIKKYYKRKIYFNINDIANVINILNYGGVYKRKIFLNISDKDFMYKIYRLYPLNDPVLNDVKVKIESLSDLIDKILKSDKTQKVRIMKKFYPIIDRVVENLNTILFYTKKEIFEFQKKKSEVASQFVYYSIVFFIVVIVINVMFLFLLLQRIENIYQELEYRAKYDGLTGLKNRVSLEEDLKNINALILIDIENFGNINELYGIKGGNEYLIEFVRILKKVTNGDIYRVGSDEFAITFKNIKNIKRYAKQLYEKITSEKIFLKTAEITIPVIDVKMGLANGVENLLQTASHALHKAKEYNRNMYKIIKKDILEENKKIQYALLWTKKIKDALQEEKFVPYYQPITDKNLQIYKYEVLVRMKENDKIILPSAFLDIAIKNRQYIAISKMLFEKMRKDIPISFNISYLDIESRDMRVFLLKEIKNLPEPQLLTLEMVETQGIINYETVKKFFETVKSYGAKIAIDDFGSGYSNFSRILELKPDILKIDGSLIKNIDIYEDKQKLVKSIVMFAKELEIKTVAEYIETESVFEICKDMQIDYFQGTYLAKPSVNIDDKIIKK